jgi:hypothetical protein
MMVSLKYLFRAFLVLFIQTTTTFAGTTGVNSTQLLSVTPLDLTIILLYFIVVLVIG